MESKVTTKKTVYPQTYKKSWQMMEQFQNWLVESRKGPHFAYCIACDKHMNIVSGKSVLRRHASTRAHRKKMDKRKSEFPDSSCEEPPDKKEDAIKLHISGFTEDEQDPCNCSDKMDVSCTQALGQTKNRVLPCGENMNLRLHQYHGDEFDLFCQSLAVQLKEMPLHRALICQEKLQSVIVKERLALLADSDSTGAHLTAHHATAGPNSTEIGINMLSEVVGISVYK